MFGLLSKVRGCMYVCMYVMLFAVCACTIRTIQYRYRYQRHGVFFEFYDALNQTDPLVLMRKGKRTGGVRDYHWTAALTFRMLLEIDKLTSARV